MDAAVGLFDTTGIGVSTAKVAAAAGVSNGTLFHYFPTKQALLDGVYLALKAELAAAIGPIDEDEPIREVFRHIWTRWIGWGLSHSDRERVTTLLRTSGLVSPEAAEHGMAALEPAYRQFATAWEAGHFIDLPLDYLISSVKAQLRLCITLRMDPQQQALAFDALWAGIRADR